MTATRPWVPALASPMAHSREMLFGFGLGVVAGYLLGGLPAARLWPLFALWLLARATWLLAPGSAAAALASAAFAVLVGAATAPKFLRGAKKLRNRAVAPLLIALCGAAVLIDAGSSGGFPAPSDVALTAVLLFALLMLFMGGRIIAPAAAGQRYRQGEYLDARVQPRLEGALLVCMGVAIVLSLAPPTRIGAGWAAIAAGALAAVRMLRWELWRCRGRADLWCLGAGYAWIAVGLFVLGAALAAGIPPHAHVHGITVGAIGTLTFNMMARSSAARAGQNLARSPVIYVGTALIGVAAGARLAVLAVPVPALPLLWLAAIAWSLAFVLLALRLLSQPPP